MEDVTAGRQPAEHLESLLEILACPLDNSVPLSAVRDAAGEIVALRSKDAEYSVVHNVPYLIPELGEVARGGSAAVAGAPKQDVAEIPGW